MRPKASSRARSVEIRASATRVAASLRSKVCILSNARPVHAGAHRVHDARRDLGFRAGPETMKGGHQVVGADQGSGDERKARGDDRDPS